MNSPRNLQIVITVGLEEDLPDVRFTSSKPANIERMRVWLDRRPELRELVDQAVALRRREAA